MPRKHTPSFVLELPLHSRPAQERAGGINLRAAHNIHNAGLGEALTRLDLMRASPAWKAARAMPRGEPRSNQRKARSEAFERVPAQFSFTKSAREEFARECARASISLKEHLPGHCIQTTATPALKAVERHMLRIGGRPHFKAYRNFNSFEESVWERSGERHRARSKLRAVVTPGVTGNKLSPATHLAAHARRCGRGPEGFAWVTAF